MSYQQEERPTVVLKLENVLAGRIWTQFRNDPLHNDIAKKFFDAIQDAVRKNKQAPDEALIPVTVHLTQQQATTIKVAFQPWIGFPHDARVYKAVSDALENSKNG